MVTDENVESEYKVNTGIASTPEKLGSQEISLFIRNTETNETMAR